MTMSGSARGGEKMAQGAGRFEEALAGVGERRLDLVCIGRGIADLYADQLGGRLEDAISFSIYVGGSACNICIGAARLGMQTAMILRVGDDHMGRTVRETLARNGVDVSGVRTDPQAPTPICVLGVRDQQTFPRDLFAKGGAYLNLQPDDLDPELFRDARAVLINGSFFASDELRATCRRALDLAREAGCATALDIDYRPALWGLVGHGEGEAAFVASDEVTRHFAEFLPDFDLVVGTEEEIAIAGGAEDSLEAVRGIRALSEATIVLKRGPAGCVTFDGPIPDDLEQGTVVPGFEIEVMNTAGAGDSFMAGMTTGWLRRDGIQAASRLANACGAVNVARHGCSDSAPSDKEIALFMQGGIRQPEESAGMRRLHALLGRQDKPVPDGVLDLGRVLPDAGRDLLRATAATIAEGGVKAVIWPATEGFSTLAVATGRGAWIARNLPDACTGSGLGAGVRLMSTLRRWPREHVVRIAPQGADDMEKIAAICAAAAETRHEVLLDLREAADPSELARALLAAGLRPEWWMLDEDRGEIEAEIDGQDVPPRGVIVQTEAWRGRSERVSALAGAGDPAEDLARALG
ncbi:5-dehydro-2-deoxygluconokinase [Aquicoccus sp. SCR17]|nr:5-dehydro-2-deoxygluconokinase [Carideicomes alvinocaridis]